MPARKIIFITLLLTGAVFWPGLSGGFFYDDFPHLLNNHAILLDELTLRNLYQAAFSGHAGPTGRPLAMASFAVEHALAGAAPFHFKLANLLLHLANAMLAAWLVSLLMAAAPQEPQSRQALTKWLPLWVAALWALHPLTASAVLYVVQRMTLLAAFLSLLGMISYCSGRLALLDRKRGWGRILLLTPALLLAGVYSKETAVVAAPILVLIEAVIFRLRMGDEASARKFRFGFIAVTTLGAAAAGWMLYTALPGFLAGYQIREFTATERLLTEARILWKYIALCLIPDFRDMALFHDDFPISANLLAPITTLASIAGLIILLGAAVAARKRLPLVTLGIGWFLIGHLPESTVIPLELMHEHRNYFPLLGLILAIVAALHELPAIFPAIRQRVFLAVGFSLLAMLGLSTLARSMELGDAKGYFIYEAFRHPDSARANTEAALRLLDAMAIDPERAAQLAPQTRLFLDRAIASNPNEIHALFAGVMAQPFISHDALTAYHRELKKRLQSNIPHRSTGSLFGTLNELLRNGNISLTTAQAEELYEAALSNPRLSGRTEVDILVGYASYQASLQGDMNAALRLIDTAAAKSGNDPGVNYVRASLYISAGKFKDAESLIPSIERNDKTGYYAKGLKALRDRLSNPPQ